jgi:hypothetical protein
MKDQDEQMYAYETWLSKYGGYASSITLRDHFAGLAMQAFCSTEGAEKELPDDLAAAAYEQADSMLRARDE